MKIVVEIQASKGYCKHCHFLLRQRISNGKPGMGFRELNFCRAFRKELQPGLTGRCTRLPECKMSITEVSRLQQELERIEMADYDHTRLGTENFERLQSMARRCAIAIQNQQQPD